MSKKKDDLEAIVDRLHEWCVEYDERFMDIWILTENDGKMSGCNVVDTKSVDYDELRLFKDYETSVVEATEKSGLGGDPIDCPEAG